MPKRVVNGLTAIGVKRASKVGWFADGNGLYLQVKPGGIKSWLFRYMLDGKAHAMGLGSIDTWTLAEARARAIECRKLLHDGTDPLAARRDARQRGQDAIARRKSFDDCAALLIASKREGWKNAKHAAQWQTTLKTYATPVFGDWAVDRVDTAAVMRVLEPIWSSKAETAMRLRARIEAVLDYSTVMGLRAGSNPAKWKGHLQSLLANHAGRERKHHAALPWAEINDFLTALHRQEGVSARALRFTILTVARTNEVIGATRGEIDFEGGTWTIPAARMKAKKEHVVPLSTEALEIIQYHRDADPEVYLFANGRSNSPLSNMAMLTLLRRNSHADITVHGFRSTFREWAGETTNFQREVIEHALAHQLADKAEAAYQRGSLLAKRAKLMQAWAAFCTKRQSSAKVTALRMDTADRKAA